MRVSPLSDSKFQPVALRIQYYHVGVATGPVKWQSWDIAGTQPTVRIYRKIRVT